MVKVMQMLTIGARIANGIGAPGWGFRRLLGCAGVVMLAASCFAAAGEAEKGQTIEWKGQEQRIAVDTTYKDVTIIARCDVIVEEGCTLTLDNVRMLIEQRVSEEEEKTGNIDFSKNNNWRRNGISVKGKLVARRWRLNEISGKKGIPYEISVNLLGKADLTGCALGDRVNFFCIGDAMVTATDSTISGMIQTYETSRNTFKKCKLGTNLPNRYIETHGTSRNTFEDCEMSGVKMDIFKSATNEFTRCTINAKTWFWGNTVNSFDGCTFTVPVAFKGESQNKLKGCRFTHVGFSEKAKLQFLQPASEANNVDVYVPNKSALPLHPEIRGYASLLSLKKFEKGIQITRFFPIVVQTGDRKPEAGVKVQIVDKAGKSVAEGVTDKDGFVELGVAFNADNYKEGNFWLAVKGEKKRGLSFTDASIEPLRIDLKGVSQPAVGQAQAGISGTVPNATGDTIVDRDTVWRGEKITLGGDLTVQKGRSFTIENCDVLFNVTCPQGRMVCEAGTTIVIKDSYLHGRSEFDRAAGIVLGGENDRLTVKITGTTFKYLGTWDERPGSAKITPMFLAKAVYDSESSFRGNSLICEERPGYPGPMPGKNWIWGLIGPLDGASATPAHGLKIEDCFFFQHAIAIYANRYLSQSCIIGAAMPLDTPSPHFVSDANWFEDSTHKPYNLFAPSHHGLTKDNYFRNSGIAFTTSWLGKPEGLVFLNNIMLTVPSPYMKGWKEGGAGGGWGDEAVFIGNEIINCDRGFLGSGGKDWVWAGNKMTNTGGQFGLVTQAYPGLDVSTSAAERERYKREKFGPSRQESIDHLNGAKRGNLVIGNKFDNCGGVSGGVCIGVANVWGTTYGKDAVIAGNEITNCKARGIWLSNTNRAVIKNNTIKGNGTGIEISPDSTDCNVIGNKMSGNGVDVKGSASNTKAFPEAKILSPATNEFKAGQAVTFKGEGTAKGEKKIVSYWWFFGDGTMSTEQNPTHTFKKDGKYFVAFLVSDSAGLRDIAIMQGKIDAVWNQSDDPLRPWPERKPRLAAYPNPLFLTCSSPATFVPYYYMGKVVVRISDATGKVVRELDGRGFKAPGVLEWDLKDADGNLVSSGEYAAVAIDEKGEEVSRCKLSVLK